MNDTAQLLRRFKNTFRWTNLSLARAMHVSNVTIHNILVGKSVSYGTTCRLNEFFEQHEDEVNFLK